MPRSSNGRHRKQATIGLAALLGVSGITAAAIAMSTGASQAAENCTGLDTALRNNLTFIEGQQANPDAQSAARIANRQSVVDLIQQRRQAAGCTGDVGKAPDQRNGENGQNCQGNAKDQDNGGNAKGDNKNKDKNQQADGMGNGMGVNGMNGQGAANGMNNAQGNADQKGMAQDNGKNGKDADKNKDQNGKAGQRGNQCQQGKGAQNGKNGKNQNSGQQAGDVVCQGSTVTLSGEGGAPAASSGQFPAGTKLKVTNLDNDKSTTVEVTSASGSCALLNNAAFEQIREAGKFLIRNARIERVG